MAIEYHRHCHHLVSLFLTERTKWRRTNWAQEARKDRKKQATVDGWKKALGECERVKNGKWVKRQRCKEKTTVDADVPCILTQTTHPGHEREREREREREKERERGSKKFLLLFFFTRHTRLVSPLVCCQLWERKRKKKERENLAKELWVWEANINGHQLKFILYFLLYSGREKAIWPIIPFAPFLFNCHTNAWVEDLSEAVSRRKKKKRKKNFSSLSLSLSLSLVGVSKWFMAKWHSHPHQLSASGVCRCRKVFFLSLSLSFFFLYISLSFFTPFHTSLLYSLNER